MRWLSSLLIMLLGWTFLQAGDWPQWLGPNRDGSSPEKVAAWSEPPKVLWRQPIDEGHSSPVVAGGKVLIHTRVKDKEEERVTAFEIATGTWSWKQTYSRTAFKSAFGNGPRATPVIHDGKVYSFGATGLLSCLSMEDGKQLWQVNCLKEFKAANLFFGVSCSPLLEDKKVLVNVGGAGASIVAFDPDTGKVAWKTGDDRASYSSPIAIGEGKDRQVVFLTQQGLIGLNPADGKVFWKFPLVDKLSESSTTPVKMGDLLLGSSVTFGSAAVKFGTKGGKTVASEAWKNPLLTCYFSTPVAIGDQIYMLNGSIIPPPSATLRCVDSKTGKVLWTQPKVGKYHATLLRTGDDKLLMLDDAGNLVLLDPDPKEYKELARAKVCGETWAHPALSDGKLFIRDDKELICLELK